MLGHNKKLRQKKALGKNHRKEIVHVDTKVIQDEMIRSAYSSMESWILNSGTSFYSFFIKKYC